MAQLLAPAAPGSERISQILPSVKCSNCNQPVRLAELGDHVCAPLPPVPSLPALKTPSSPRSVAALLPTRLQNLVSTPPAQSPPRKQSVSQAPPRQNSPAPAPQPHSSQPTRRSRAPGAPPPARTPTPHIEPDTKSGGEAGMAGRVLPPSQEAPKVTLPDAPSTPRLPFFEKFKNKLPAVDTSTPSPQAGSGSADPSPLSPQSDDGSYDGLAYANSDEEEDEEDVPLRASPLPLATPTKPAGAAGGGNRVRFPSMTNSESKYSSASSSSSSTTSPRMPQRKLSTSTVGSSYSSRTISKSTGALDRAMETLFEDLPTSPTTSTSSARPLVSPGAPTADTHRDSVPKPPTRSHTSPTLPSSARAEAQKSASRRPRRRVCLRCEKHIEDGRWIQVEGGNVLCDKCWKNMYLPKVSARLCLGTGTRTWTQTRARTRCRCRSADGVHTRARAKGSKIAPSISVSYATLEGIYMSCEGIYTSREGIYTSREGIYTSREGIYTSREGIYTSREDISSVYLL
ncbi:hypothetical protein BC628DRAFT_1545689 [Trametes gibbosa]|nr:hypothetical protein BC628DRAFT_1545689 [Trametes gibbosa]